MKKEFVSYKQSLELKKLGFDEPCFGIHYNEGLNPSFIVASQYGEHGATANGGILAPLYQQVFRWFREKYQLHSTITSISQESWQWHITKPGESLGKLYDEDFYTYEEAELECIKKLIEIVKDK